MRWILGTTSLIICSFVIFLAYLHQLIFTPGDYDHPPKFIEADYIDLTKINTISKYRSAIGHSTDDSVEKCVSLRHIFGWQGTVTEFTNAEEKWEVLHTRPTPENSINIFAPVNGLVVDVFSSSHLKDKQGFGGAIVIRPDNAPGYMVRIDSLFIEPGIRFLTRVKAGDKIGVICRQCPGEISIGYNYIFRKTRGFLYSRPIGSGF